MFANLGLGHLRRDQFFTLGRVDAIETGPSSGRAGDAEMHLGGTGIQQHFLDLAGGGATHDRVVDQNDPFASNQRAVHVQFQTHTHVADRVGGFDKGPAHVLVPDDAHAVRDAAFVAIADGGWGAAVRNGANKIRVNGGFLGQFDADLTTVFIDRPSTKDRIRTAKIDVFKDAETRL